MFALNGGVIVKKDDLSDFLRYAYSKGKVKDVEEAFVEYTVEEE